MLKTLISLEEFDNMLLLIRYDYDTNKGKVIMQVDLPYADELIVKVKKAFKKNIYLYSPDGNEFIWTTGSYSQSPLTESQKQDLYFLLDYLMHGNHTEYIDSVGHLIIEILGCSELIYFHALTDYKNSSHEAICKELTDLYKRKNADYGNSFAELRKEYPDAILIRLTDKLNRLKKLYDSEYKAKVSDESVDDTLKDLANYAIMELIERGYTPK